MSKATTARAPVTPLIVHDPFMSVWSWSDTATDTWPGHWTGKQNQMSGLLRIDGQPYRFMGRKQPHGRQGGCHGAGVARDHATAHDLSLRRRRH